MLTQTSNLAAAELPPRAGEFERPAAVANYSEADASKQVSHTVEYLRPTEEELSFAWELVNQVSQTTLVVECNKLTVEAGDPYLAQHSYRVAIAATILGQRFGLSREELELTATAAQCHDIGRTEPEIQETANAPIRYEGAARERAMKIISRHVEVGVGIIRAFGIQKESTELVAEMVEAHHSYSKIDSYGSRPSHFEAGAEIIAFADELDALASDRPYHDAFSEQETRRILEEQFDGSLGLIGVCFDTCKHTGSAEIAGTSF